MAEKYIRSTNKNRKSNCNATSNINNRSCDVIYPMKNSGENNMFEVISNNMVQVRYPKLGSCQNYIIKMKKKDSTIKFSIRTPSGEIQDA